MPQLPLLVDIFLGFAGHLVFQRRKLFRRNIYTLLKRAFGIPFIVTATAAGVRICRIDVEGERERELEFDLVDLDVVLKDIAWRYSYMHIRLISNQLSTV